MLVSTTMYDVLWQWFASSCLHALMTRPLPLAVVPSSLLAAWRIPRCHQISFQLIHHRFSLQRSFTALITSWLLAKVLASLGSYICSTPVGRWTLRISLLSAPWPQEDRYMLRLLMKDHPFLLGHAYYYNILLGCFGVFRWPKWHQKGACLVLFCSRTRNWSLSVIMGSLKNILWFQRPILAVRASLDPCYNIIKL